MKSEQKNPDAVELAPLPAPVDFESDIDRPVPFDAGATVRLDCPDAAAATWLARHFAAMEPMADFLAAHGGLGMIATTWHHLHGTDWRDIFRTAACAAWGTPPRPVAPQFDTAFAVALRLAGLDAGVSSYRDTGLVEDQLSLP